MNTRLVLLSVGLFSDISAFSDHSVHIITRSSDCCLYWLLGNFLIKWVYVCETDLLTVSETATEPPQEEGTNLNSPKNLSLEATFVNHNFSQQVLKIVSRCWMFVWCISDILSVIVAFAVSGLLV